MDLSAFCPLCGNLLTVPDIGDVSCGQCDYAVPIRDLPNEGVVTRSFPKPTPEWMLEYRAGLLRAKGGPNVDTTRRGARATVKEECPKCKHPFMEFYTMQLRSADEGQTVFYECPAPTCGHKYSVNT